MEDTTIRKATDTLKGMQREITLSRLVIRATNIQVVLAMAAGFVLGRVM